MIDSSSDSSRWSLPFELGRSVVSCNAPYGSGGLGRHFAEIIDDLRWRSLLQSYFSGAAAKGQPGEGVVLPDPMFDLMARWTPLRFSRGWLNHLHGDRHDRRVANEMSAAAETFIGFGNQSLRTFGAAKKLKFKRLGLVAANSHAANVRRQHARALRDHPLDRSWLNDAQFEKTLKEYEAADIIICASDYTHQTMVEAGVDERKLVRFRYAAHPRFKPAAVRSPSSRFRVVYCGSVTPMKGVPVLIEAFRRLTMPDAELCIVGGTSNRQMRQYMTAAIAKDRRICMAPADPLPILQEASAYVHPSYEDGLAYSPMESLACGVPVIVTEDTGMKQHVREGVNGFIVPTGKWEPILERLDFLVRHPLQWKAAALEAATSAPAQSVEVTRFG